MVSNAKDAKWLTGLMNVESGLTKVVRIWCSFWYAALIICMILQVFTRFVLEAPLPWTDEGARYLWATLCFIGCGAAITDNAHIEINIISSLLKGIEDEGKKFRLARIADIVRFITLIGLGGLLSYLTGNYMIMMMKTGQVSAAMELPVWVLYALLLFGFVSVVFHSICRLVITIADHPRIIDPIITGGDD